MNNVIPPRLDIPNYTNYQPAEELVRLRKRVGDLLKLGAATPDTYLQTVMQLFQEGERRRQQCMADAEDHLRKYHALVAQAHGFSAMSSVLYSVINGFATLEERRLQEMAEREKEKAESAKPEVHASPTNPAQEGAGTPEVKSEANNKPSGGKRSKKP
jgi:hypothetical protein